MPTSHEMSNKKDIKYGFNTDRMMVVLSYLLALAGAWVSIQFFSDSELWIKIAIGDLVGTVIIFFSSLIFRNSSMYDPYWSVAPIIILIYLIVINGFPAQYLRTIMISIIVLWWGIRLTANWLRTWPGLKHEDWRYRSSCPHRT